MVFAARITPKWCGVLALVLAMPAQSALAEDWIDPCNGYQAYVAAGGGDSAPALALQRVCEVTGARRISQACLVYYTRKTAEYPVYTAQDLAPDATACNASMPGELAQDECGAPGAECVAPDLHEDQVPEDCGQGGLECAPPPAPEPLSGPVPGPAAGPNTGLGGTNMSAGQPTPAAPPIAPSSTTDDNALDLAFWNSVKDSGNPLLYQAYLDKFPNGVFAPIARILRDQASTQAGTGPGSDTAFGGDDPDGHKAFDAAERIMNAAYERDASQWDAAAVRALPLYQSAAARGLAEAWLALGDLHEIGLGTPADNSAALAAFRKAAALGAGEGHERALYLLDQLGDDAGFVAQFLTYYRVAPEAALALLDGVSAPRSRALQVRLRDAGYYGGALDGAFGPASRRALAGFVAGALIPAPATPQPAAGPEDSLTADIQRQLARLGCYHGPVDGKWGPATSRAMENYNYWSGDNGATDGPSELALKLVSIALAPVCGVD